MEPRPKAGRARALRGYRARPAQGSCAVCLWLSQGLRAAPLGPREASFGSVLKSCRTNPALLQDLRTVRAKLAMGGAGHARAMRGPTRLVSLGAQAGATRAVSRGLIGDPRMASFMLLMPVLAGTAAEVPDWWSDAGEGGGEAEGRE